MTQKRSSQTAQSEETRIDLIQKWDAFNIAIRDIKSDFDQFYWIRTLFVAATKYLLHFTRAITIIHFIHRNCGHVLQFLPLVAALLVCSVILAYFLTLHGVVGRRWCDGEESCGWSRAIAIFTWYIGFMIIYNYMKTTFTSPGVVSTFQPGNCKTNREEQCCWKSYSAQGGFSYIHAAFNATQEQALVSLYKMEEINDDHFRENDEEGRLLLPESGTVFLPSPYSSFCNKCKRTRPPRCHHCSKCNRCVLQVSWVFDIPKQ